MYRKYLIQKKNEEEAKTKGNEKKKKEKERESDEKTDSIVKISVDFIEEILDLKNYSFNETQNGLNSNKEKLIIRESKKPDQQILKNIEVNYQTSSIDCFEKSDALRLIEKVGDMKEDQFQKKLTKMIEKRIDTEEEAAEVFADIFPSLLQGCINSQFLEENQLRMKEIIFQENEQTNSEEDQEVEKQVSKKPKKKEKPSNFYKNEQKKDKGNHNNDQTNSFMGTMENNIGCILILKSPFTSKEFYHTFDECLLCLSPFETRRNSEALRLFEEFWEFWPSEFSKQPIYNQNYRDPSFFDMILHNGKDSLCESKFKTICEYFGKMGLFSMNFGFCSLTDLNNLFEKDPNFEPLNEDDSKEEHEMLLKEGFIQFLEFIIWMRSTKSQEKASIEKKEKNLSFNKNLFNELKIKTAKTTKKRGFDVNDYKGTPFFYFYKVIINPS